MARLNLIDTIQTGPVGEPRRQPGYDERPDWFNRLGEDRAAAVGGQERRRPHPVLQRQEPGVRRRRPPSSAGRATRWSRSTTTSWCWPTRRSPSCPNWVIALVAAGGLAAALSTAAGLLLAISSSISHDLLKGMFMPRISETGASCWPARIAMAGAIVVAGYLGLNPPGFAAEVVAFAFGLAASSLLPGPDDGHLRQARSTRRGAIAGMLVGIVSRPWSTSSGSRAGSSSRAPTWRRTAGQLALRHLAGGIRRRRRAAQLRRRLGRVAGDAGAARAHPAPGRGHPRPAWRGHSHRPLIGLRSKAGAGFASLPR